MNRLTSFETADLRALEIARHYYEETKMPFVVSVGKFSGWDCQSMDGTIRIEIKYETTPERTGNVCIEYWNCHLDQPSGVLATECTLWVHIIPENEGFIAIEYEIAQLRKIVIQKKIFGTNGHDALFKLIPIDEFKKSAKRIYKYENKLYSEGPKQ